MLILHHLSRISLRMFNSRTGSGPPARGVEMDLPPLWLINTHPELRLLKVLLQQLQMLINGIGYPEHWDEGRHTVGRYTPKPQTSTLIVGLTSQRLALVIPLHGTRLACRILGTPVTRHGRWKLSLIPEQHPGGSLPFPSRLRSAPKTTTSRSTGYLGPPLGCGTLS